MPSKTSGRSYAVTGVARVVGDDAVDVVELPVRRWTQDYKEFLEGLLKGAAAAPAASGRGGE